MKKLIKKTIKTKTKIKISFITSYNIDQYYYYKNKLIYTNLNKINNLKDSEFKKFKLKNQKSNLIINFFKNMKTFNKV